jgi:DNA-binding NarL/FixJ family response regulator
MHGIINLIIAHGHPHFLVILQNIIRSYQGMRVVGKASNLTDLLDVAASLKPDIIIIDIGLPGLKGLTHLQMLSLSCEQAKLIFSWQHEHFPVISLAIQAGCTGCIIQDANPQDYLIAIKQAMKGEVYYCRQTEKVINTQMKEGADSNALAEELSHTYCRLLYCISLGYNGKETALAMGLSKETVDTYRKDLRKIIGSRSIHAIVNFMKKNALL